MHIYIPKFIVRSAKLGAILAWFGITAFEVAGLSTSSFYITMNPFLYTIQKMALFALTGGLVGALVAAIYMACGALLKMARQRFKHQTTSESL